MELHNILLILILIVMVGTPIAIIWAIVNIARHASAKKEDGRKS